MRIAASAAIWRRSFGTSSPAGAFAHFHSKPDAREYRGLDDKELVKEMRLLLCDGILFGAECDIGNQSAHLVGVAAQSVGELFTLANWPV